MFGALLILGIIWHSRLFTHLYDFLDKPGHGLQQVQVDLLQDLGLQGPVVWTGQLHPGKQVRDDPLEQRDVLLKELQEKTASDREELNVKQWSEIDEFQCPRWAAILLAVRQCHQWRGILSQLPP